MIGGETGETNGDMLDASALTTGSILDLSAGDGTNPEDGTLTVDPTGGAGASPAMHYVRVFKPDAAVTGSGVYPSGAIDFSQGEWFYVPVADMDIFLDGVQSIGGTGVDTSQTFASDFDGLFVEGNGVGADGKAEYLDANGNPFFVDWVSDDYSGATRVPANTYLIVTDAGGAEPSGIATSTGLQDANAQFDYSSFTTPIQSANFSEIETVILGSGNDSVIGSTGDDHVFTGARADTVDGGEGNDSFDLGAADGAVDYVVLSDGDGDDAISGFEAPIDNGDGTYSGRDQLDVSDLTSDGGTTPVTTADIVVIDTNGDGTGDAILTVPGGESTTLVGVLASQVDTPAELEAIGIPGIPPGQVDGTAAADDMFVGYVDAQGDFIYGADGLDDTISGYGGDDTIQAGEGDDLIYGGDGNDWINGNAGNDSAYGGEGNDTILVWNGNNLAEGGAGNDTLTGGDGADTLLGGDDRDLFVGGIGDVIDGGEGGDDFDRLNLAALGGAAMTNVIYGGGNNEDGTVEVLDGTGAVLGSFAFSNIESVVPCFTPGTMILTNKGETLVEDLQVGDRVLTRDHGYQTLRWVGTRSLSGYELVVKPRFNPVCIQAGALGAGLPERDMTVSPQHRMLVTAVHLINDSTIRQISPQSVTYIHLWFDMHELIRGDGTWTESFQSGDQTLQAMDRPQRDELLALFPTLQKGEAYPAARVTLKFFEAKVLLGL